MVSALVVVCYSPRLISDITYGIRLRNSLHTYFYPENRTVIVLSLGCWQFCSKELRYRYRYYLQESIAIPMSLLSLEKYLDTDTDTDTDAFYLNWM